jgi:L-asparaginase II
MATPEAFAPVAITRRSGCDESVHFGAVVGLAPNGDIEFEIGDPFTAIYPRSSNKPMQAVAMVRAGLQLPPELLALVCASHDGTPKHLEGVRRILASAGLQEELLANTPAFRSTRMPPRRCCDEVEAEQRCR